LFCFCRLDEANETQGEIKETIKKKFLKKEKEVYKCKIFFFFFFCK